MSSRRMLVSGMVATLVVAGGVWYAMGAFPLAQSPLGTSGTVGVLETQSNPITPENPIPRRLYAPSPAYPGAAVGSGIGGTVNLRVTLDAFGRVAETRRQQMRLTNPTGLPDAPWLAMLDAFAEAAETAVAQWTYDPPAEPPITFDVVARFDPEGETTTAQTVRADTRGEIALGPPPPSPPPAALDELASNGALRVGDNLPPPKKVTDVPPVYPQDAQDLRIGGVVVLEIVIDEAGHVADARVMRSIPILDQAALDAVRQWEYEPTLLNGVPVSIVMFATVNFTLS